MKSDRDQDDAEAQQARRAPAGAPWKTTTSSVPRAMRSRPAPQPSRRMVVPAYVLRSRSDVRAGSFRSGDPGTLRLPACANGRANRSTPAAREASRAWPLRRRPSSGRPTACRREPPRLPAAARRPPAGRRPSRSSVKDRAEISSARRKTCRACPARSLERTSKAGRLASGPEPEVWAQSSGPGESATATTGPGQSRRAGATGTGSMAPPSTRRSPPITCGGKIPGKAIVARTASNTRPWVRTSSAPVSRLVAVSARRRGRPSKVASPSRSLKHGEDSIRPEQGGLAGPDAEEVAPHRFRRPRRQLVDGTPDGVPSGDHAAHARSGQAADPVALLLEDPKHAQVRQPSGASASQSDGDLHRYILRLRCAGPARPRRFPHRVRRSGMARAHPDRFRQCSVHPRGRIVSA